MFRSVFVEREISDQDLLYAHQRYGPIPRVCFDLAGELRRIRIYDQELARDPFDSSSLLKVITDNGLSEKFVTSFASALMITPDDFRLPLVTFVSRYMAGIAGSALGKWTGALSAMYSETSTRGGARDWYETTMLREISRGSFSYNSSCQTLCSTPSVAERPETDGRYFHIPFEPVSRLDFRVAYVFERKYILSYDSIIFTDYIYTIQDGGSSCERRPSLWLFKVIGALDSPINLEELDQLADMLPGYCQPAAIAGHWKLVFIVPNIIKDDFKTQPYLGVGKLDWVTNGLISQYTTGVDI